MTRKPHGLAALAALCLSLSACAPLPQLQREAARAHESEGGIGGTGVFGEVAGFGSIRVAGLRVETTPEMVAGLAVGDVVVIAAEEEDGRLEARSVALFEPLVGPVTGPREVMGVALRPVDAEAAEALDSLEIGRRVSARGVWAGDALLATRIVLDPAGPDRIAGLRGERGGGATIAGAAVAGPIPEGGPFLAAEGRWDGGVLRAQTARASAHGPFDGPQARAVVEGVLARDPEGDGLHLAGFGAPLDPASPAVADDEAPGAAEIGVRRVFVGRLDGAFLVEEARAPH